jgi:DNA polymerase eta
MRCSLHKPAQQTVLPAAAVPALLGPLPLPKLKGLGGKFGERVSWLTSIFTCGSLAAASVVCLIRACVAPLWGGL